MKKTLTLFFTVFLSVAFYSAFALGVKAATFTVSTTADSGSGSLRQAVNDANASASDDTIVFSSALSSQSIVLASEITISNNGALTITGLGANVLTIDGGAGTNRIFYIDSARVSISGVTLTGGNGTGAVTSGAGGAILATNATVVLDGVHVTNNSGTGTASVNNVGGVYYNGGSNHQIINSTFSANTAAGDCGGFLSHGSITVTNSTISCNTVNGNGGGFCTSGPTTLRNITVTGNSANSGGGIYHFGSSLNIGNTIVAGNSAATNSDINNEGSGITTNGYNLIGVNASVETTFPAGNPNINNDIVGTSAAAVDPRLALLANYGGTTPTHALLTSSPAIDRGFSFSSTTDQRGLSRPVDNPNIANATGGDGSDIGAFEVQFGPTIAGVSVSGRVVTRLGRGVRNVQITLTDSIGNKRTVTSTAFGYYRFEDVPAGETVTLQAKGRRFSFVQSVLVRTVNDQISNADFITID